MNPEESSLSSVDDYEVFLSFRGMDTRQGFADVLYDHMCRAGIRVFKDGDEIPMGGKISSILPAAVKRSKICVPIFSPSFASSKWCLDEVATMVELNRRIIPIFYKVKPDDVKLKETSVYTDDLRKHGVDEEKRIKWESALTQAASNKGPVLQEQGYTDFCHKFVNEILHSLGPRKRLELDDSVEINDQFKMALELFDAKSCEVQYILIHGKSSIGKTNLAKFIYNERSTRFDCCSFVSEIGRLSVPNGLYYLLKLLYKNLEPKSLKEGFNSSEQIKERFCRKKVLIVLDDIDSHEQIKKLAGESTWFGSGSRIIITTRNKNVLMACAKVKESEVGYLEMEAVEKMQTPQLFNKQAHGGLPSSIKVMGSRLHRKKEKMLKHVVKMIKDAPHEELKKKLITSYNALTDKTKK